MRVTPTELRKDLYRLLDRALETGRELTIERNGRTLRVVPDTPTSKLQRLTDHGIPDLVVNPDEPLDTPWDWREPALLDRLDELEGPPG